ncbi:hypothetical protein COL5a_006303 [Colletotrichum fioriniae]|uniref:uncharacterized protein n=1 Tax=Colletotrichum fioriniae TaxID=710243 RepID=UPI0023003507|nr:uncharacterized protein COL516b_005272 [Colletotrichum fioriniae]KAJ0305576.1 hypothetical protein COL516b_005272 [Colletotrichum fioriniae]KAJ0327126.1 hypothetical protein COL5a_006303 [Colletotrichum fioriniae]KAJ3938622.1 hypothetical protein N0V96_011352 [Colletotrichum fioriniae]
MSRPCTSANASHVTDQPPSYDAVQQQQDRQVQNFDSKEWECVPKNLSIIYSPVPIGAGANVSRRGISWEARFRVRAKDLPRLMREGLHWTIANIHREAGYFEYEAKEPVMKEAGWTCTRNYYLSDLSPEQNWTAKMTVCARDLQTLARFDMAKLRPEQAYTALAWTNVQPGQYIYNFERLAPGRNFNAIYDEMPMEGWWPWPKRQPDADNKPDSATKCS